MIVDAGCFSTTPETPSPKWQWSFRRVKRHGVGFLSIYPLSRHLSAKHTHASSFIAPCAGDTLPRQTQLQGLGGPPPAGPSHLWRAAAADVRDSGLPEDETQDAEGY